MHVMDFIIKNKKIFLEEIWLWDSKGPPPPQKKKKKTNILPQVPKN